ncbi:MAG: DJ-1/PfpI family protein [Betaproteobacteria bacterium]
MDYSAAVLIVHTRPQFDERLKSLRDGPAGGQNMSFGFLAFDGLEELDLIGPWELVATWSLHLGGPAPCTVIAPSMAAVTCANGLVIQPHTDFAAAPPLDYLLVPGGIGTLREVDNPPTIDFLQRVGPGCKALLSVCTGAFLLQRTGLAEGAALTTHWGSLQRLRDSGHPRVVERRWVHDGRIWSSAGVSAGMDMALAFIAQTAGEDVAFRVQFGTEYFPEGRRYGDPAAHPQAPDYLKQAR